VGVGDNSLHAGLQAKTADSRITGLRLHRTPNSETASPIVCVLKGRDGKNGVRMCCDYRYLNKFTRGDAYPIPDISDIIHKVGKANWISSWDMRSGYYQLLVKLEHRWLIGFVTDFGTFRWVSMPFGLKCASNIFIRVVQQVLQPIQEFCDSCVDDLATFSDHWMAHLAHDTQVFIHHA